MVKLILELLITMACSYLLATQIIIPLLSGLPLFPFLNARFSQLDKKLQKKTEDDVYEKLSERLHDEKE